jgi:putative transposase
MRWSKVTSPPAPHILPYAPFCPSPCLPGSVKEIIATVIEQVFPTRQRPTIQPVATEIMVRCRAAGIQAPHSNTIRRRIARIPEQVETKRRNGTQAARGYTPLEGNFPIPETPLGVVQIDHTKVDIRRA